MKQSAKITEELVLGALRVYFDKGEHSLFTAGAVAVEVVGGSVYDRRDESKQVKGILERLHEDGFLERFRVTTGVNSSHECYRFKNYDAVAKDWLARKTSNLTD
ncbi:MAG TPA: hypothetical protein VJH90_04020 [archaeon]|nr:hypothetical protein [archaeon]